MPDEEENPELQALLTSPPAGFKVVRHDYDRFVVNYRRSGMGCMNGFLIIWLVGWTVACGYLVNGYFNGAKMDSGEDMPLWFLMVFLLSDAGVACLLAFLLFTRKTFTFEPHRLTIETDTLGYKRYKVIPRDTITEVVLVKDGGGHDDSFPSWGLRLEAEGKTSLIFRQPIEKSKWFGPVIAEWSGAPFERAGTARSRKRWKRF